MTRTLNSNVLTPDTTTSDVVHLVRLKYWDGAIEQEVRLSDATSDLDINVGAGVETWVGTGVLFSISEVEESSDLDAPGVDIVFDGVDQSIISIILNNQFRGRPITIWRVWLDPSTGLQAGGATPLLLFDGFQNEAYTVQESFTDDPDAVSVSTRAVGSISTISNQRNVLSNLVSHNEMLETAGLVTGDWFFANIPAIDGIELFWGRLGDPVPFTRKTYGDGTGGDRGVSTHLPPGTVLPGVGG